MARRRGGPVGVCAVVAALLLGVAAACTPAPRLTTRVVVSGLDRPWDVAFTPGGTMLYTERSRGISAFVGGQKRLLGRPGDLRTGVGETGVMGLAVDPAYSTNRQVYACFSSTNGNDVRVGRWKVNSTTTALTDRVDLLTGIPGGAGYHQGCRLRFGPDGHLWIVTGDAKIGTSPQNPRSLAGKVLRITTTGAAAPGNAGGSFLAPIHSHGHRNQQGIAFRPSDGMAVSVQHGTRRDDEVNRLRAGGNYGWDPGSAYDETRPMTDFAKFPDAVGAVWSSGSPTVAPSGATFLQGSRWGSWNGALAVATLKGQHLRVLFMDASGRVTGHTTAVTDQGRLRSAAQGPDGDLYLTTDNGGGTDEILRVSPS